jgi:aspartyl-tRNA(Asn)/glutamyl-tRNA(Gln) amidotransferase subunit A
MYLSDIYTIPVNLAGLPAMSLPIWLAEDKGEKLPVWLHIIAGQFEEAKMFAVAKALENIVNFNK